MDWKKKLMLATGAFVSMPAAVSAHDPLVNGLRARRTGSLRRRISTVPFLYDPKEEQSIRINVRVPENKARRVYGRAISRCNSYRVGARVFKLDGEVITDHSAKIAAGAGATMVFNFEDVAVPVPTTVIARVEVTPQGDKDCLSEPALTSFTRDGIGGSDFVPSKDLAPVLHKLYFDGPVIIKDPKYIEY